MMPEPENSLTREDLMRQMKESWHELQTYLTSLTEEQLIHPTDAAGWTVKDHVIHIAAWEQAGLASLEGKSMREVLDIAPEIWEQDDDAFGINVVLQKRYQNMALEDVMQTLNQNHDHMLNKLNTMTEEDLLLPYKHYQPASTNESPVMLAIMSDTIQHYQEHIPWIKAIVEKG